LSELTSNQCDTSEFSVSVVIPAYNAGTTIAKTIESVLRQTTPVQEVIVVNDGSKDDTAEVIASFGDSVTLVNQENKGVSDARNHGVSHAKTNWIAFLDADDLWNPEKIESQVNFLMQHPDVSWCATRYFQCIGDTKAISRYPEPVPNNVESAGKVIHSLKSIATGANIWISTILIRKSLVLEAGGFHTKLSSTADNDLWFRVGKLQKSIAYLNQPLAYYMIDPDGMSRTETKKISPARFEFFERLARHIEDSPQEDRAIFESIFDRYAGQYMRNLAKAENLSESKALHNWLREKNYRIPSIKFRWIHYVPPAFIRWLKRFKTNAL
jgi:glycosyltransferase involved in cell wall biosynthesis